MLELITIARRMNPAAVLANLERLFRNGGGRIERRQPRRRRSMNG
jgi:hypothetical protein